MLPIEKQAVSSSDGQLKGKYHKECFNCHVCHVSGIFQVWRLHIDVNINTYRKLSLTNRFMFLTANLYVLITITKPTGRYALLLVVGNLSKDRVPSPIQVINIILSI